MSDLPRGFAHAQVISISDPSASVAIRRAHSFQNTIIGEPIVAIDLNHDIFVGHIGPPAKLPEVADHPELPRVSNHFKAAVTGDRLTTNLVTVIRGKVVIRDTPPLRILLRLNRLKTPSDVRAGVPESDYDVNHHTFILFWTLRFQSGPLRRQGVQSPAGIPP